MTFKQKSGLWDMGAGRYIYIEDTVVEGIDRYRQYNKFSSESGGFLLGYYKGDDIHITDFTSPMKGDRRGRYFFSREDKVHVLIARERYGGSGGKLNCIGEWHTHPEFNPTPSSIDVKGWKKFVANRKGLTAVFLIAGIETDWLGGYVQSTACVL